MKTKPMNCRKGFTLIELIVVIIIIGVIASVAFSTMGKRVPNYKLKAAAEELRASMQRAKVMAVKSNRNVGMEFTDVACPPTGGSYRMFIDNGSGGGTSKDDTMNGNEKPFLSVTLPEGVCLKSTTFAGDSGGFTAQGTASSGAGEVTLGHEKLTHEYEVSLLVSGGVRIQ